jgi:hypothetical protein
MELKYTLKEIFKNMNGDSVLRTEFDEAVIDSIKRNAVRIKRILEEIDLEEDF